MEIYVPKVNISIDKSFIEYEERKGKKENSVVCTNLKQSLQTSCVSNKCHFTLCFVQGNTGNLPQKKRIMVSVYNFLYMIMI